MSELRRDPTSGDWVVVAPERSRRPGPASAARPDFRCPFCPGHEDDTPAESWRLAAPDGGWAVRVFDNRFPILQGERARHEVIVESPRHDWDLATGNAAELLQVLRAYRARYRDARRLEPGLVSIFRNHGALSGTSLQHPHSQLVALPVVPGLIERRLEAARRHHRESGGSLYAELAERAAQGGERLVTASALLASFVPSAASVPSEVWITSRSHQGSFGDVPEATLADLAAQLRAVLGALRRVREDPSYNLVVDSVPPGEEGTGYFGWLVRILPRVTTAAGFEMATGIAVNPSLPESDAEALRAAIRELE